MTLLRLEPDPFFELLAALERERANALPEISGQLVRLARDLSAAWSGPAQQAFDANFDGWSSAFWARAAGDLDRVSRYLGAVLQSYLEQERALSAEWGEDDEASPAGLCLVGQAPFAEAPRPGWDAVWFEFRKAVLIAAAQAWWSLDGSIGAWGRFWHMQRIVTAWGFTFANANSAAPWDDGLDLWNKRWTPNWMAARVTLPWLEFALALKPAFRVVPHGAGDDLTINPSSGVLQVSDANSSTRVDLGTGAVTTRLTQDSLSWELGTFEIDGLGPVTLTYKTRGDAGLGLADMTEVTAEATRAQRLVATIHGLDFVIGLDAAEEIRFYPGPTGLVLAPLLVPAAAGAAGAEITATATALAAWLSQSWGQVQPVLQTVTAAP